MTTWLIIRFVLAALLFVLALHVVLRNPTMPGWYASVVATEFGHRLAIVALALLVPGAMQAGTWSMVGTVLLVLSASMLLRPWFAAVGIGKRLPEMMRTAFGDATRRAVVVGAPAAVPETLVYSDDEHEPRRVVFYRAAGNPDAPCIVVVHGGGWEKGSPHDLSHWSVHWASMGIAVAALQYRLAPEHVWPAQKNDLVQALDYLKRNAATLGISPDRFILLGRSAGGQIATATAYALHDPAIRGVVSIYAPADMFFARKYARSDDLLDSLGLVRRFLGGDPHEVEDVYRSASGILLATADSCPTLILHGAHDTLVIVEQSRRLARRLQELGVPHCYIEMPWATHGFDWAKQGPGSRILREAVDRFVAQVVS